MVGLQTHSGAETATYFLLDDGLATRKRRRMLLDPLYRYIGAASSSHKLHGVITIILLAEDVPEDRPHYVPLPLGDDSLMVPQYQQSYGN